ncbi:MAG: hypothetical protein U0V73_07845 [Acidimicrobiia bacterium]
MTVPLDAGPFDASPRPFDVSPCSDAPLVAFIGASGSGKSSVVRELDRRGVLRVHPTWTTRPRRADELDGSPEHRFVSDAEFAALRGGGFFLDAVQMFGLPYWYGLPVITPVPGLADAVMLRARLVDRLRVHHPYLLVYQLDASRAVLTDRLRARGYGPVELGARLTDNDVERHAGSRVATRVFRNDGSLADTVHHIELALRRDLANPRRESA